MSDKEKLIQTRMGLLAMAGKLHSVSAACRLVGISRSRYYQLKNAFDKCGIEGLAPRIKRKPEMPNRTSLKVEAKIFEMTGHYPSYSYVRISDKLKLVGCAVGPSTVRKVWERHGLSRFIDRLLRLETTSAEQGGVLSARHRSLLEKNRDCSTSRPSG